MASITCFTLWDYGCRPEIQIMLFENFLEVCHIFKVQEYLSISQVIIWSSKLNHLYTLQTYLIISENWILLHALALLNNISISDPFITVSFFFFLITHHGFTWGSHVWQLYKRIRGEWSRRRKERWWMDMISKWCPVELKHEVVWLLRPFPLHFSFTTVLPLLSTRELCFHFHFLSRG